jgi:hypothetical protein
MHLRALAAGLAVAVATTGAAPAQNFDPQELCYKQLSQADSATQLVIAAWVTGFIAGRDGRVAPVHVDNLTKVLQNLAGVCAANSQLTLLEVVARSGEPSGPGSEPDARAFLERFLAPGADRVAMTAALKPTPDDIATVYREPLASALAAVYAQLFTPGAAIGPKPEQDSVILVRTMTDNLIAGDPVVRDFPGGYGDVVALMKPGVPIVRFKFVTSGEDLGLAFDGLVFVNGAWKLMPKPWTALP